jgi:hypothetical protein
MDVGMYVSQDFLTTHASLEWVQPFGGQDQEAAGKGKAITLANLVLKSNHLCYCRIDCDNDNGNGSDLRPVQAPRKLGKYLMEQCQIADTLFIPRRRTSRT